MRSQPEKRIDETVVRKIQALILEQKSLDDKQVYENVQK
jgi:hypothetical protein